MGRIVKSIFIALIALTLMVAGLMLSGCGSGGGGGGSQEVSAVSPLVEATTSSSQEAPTGAPLVEAPVSSEQDASAVAPLAGVQPSPDPNSASASPVVAPLPDTANTSVSKQLTLAWDQSDGATSYNVYWSTVSGVTPANGTKISSISSPFVHTGLVAGATYYYVVTAADSSSESAPSVQASGVTSL